MWAGVVVVVVVPVVLVVLVVVLVVLVLVVLVLVLVLSKSTNSSIFCPNRQPRPANIALLRPTLSMGGSPIRFPEHRIIVPPLTKASPTLEGP